MEENPISDVSGAVSVINLEGRKDCSISELISFLKSAFRRNDFAKAEEMLRLREENLKVFERNSKVSESELGKKCSDLEKELGGFRTRCVELTDRNKKKEEEFWALKVELEKKEREGRELELEKIAVEEELEKYKIVYSKMEERFANLEEDHRAVCEKIASLEMEMKKKKKEQAAREKSVELKVEDRDLECEKSRAENDIADCKKQSRILDAKVLQLEEDNLYRRQQESNQKMKVESKEFLGDTCYEEKAKKGYWRMVETEHQNEVLHSSTDVGSASHSSVIKSAPQVPAVPLVVSMKSDSLGAVDYAVTTTDEGRASRVREKLSFNKRGSSDKKESPVRASAKSRDDVVVIIDSDDEMDIAAPTLNSKVGSSGFKETYCNLKSPTLQKSWRLDSDFKTAAEDDTSSCKENITPSFTPKRKRASKVIMSDNEEVDDDDDDEVPLSKLKMKRLAEVTDRGLGYPTTTSGDDNVEKSITLSRRHIIPLRQCEETKCTAKISLPSHSIGENLSLPFRINGASYLSPQKPPPESHPEDDEVEEVKSESEGERLGGFIDQGSYGSEGEDSSTDDSDEADNDLECTQVLESIRRKKKTSTWGYEADMLDSFMKDPELRMKAVCALYRQQATDEKSMKRSLHANNCGFNKFDALRGSRLAEFLTDGDPHGPLKKSVEELEEHDPMALGYCSRLASDYSKQLFEIYQSKEDPHFLPC